MTTTAPKLDQDPDVVFEEFEHLLASGEHASRATHAVGYVQACSLERLYRRHNRCVPTQLAHEANYQKNHPA